MTLSRDCLRCGAKDTLIDTLKWRNGIKGTICGLCGAEFFKKIKIYDHGASSSKGFKKESTWEETQDKRMGVKDFEGI